MFNTNSKTAVFGIFGKDGLTTSLREGEQRDALAQHFHFIEKALALYDEHAAVFCKHAKTGVIETARLDSYEKLRNFDAKTLEAVITHSEELMQVRPGSSIEINRKYYATRHSLVSYRINSKATPENLAIMGFLKTLEV